MTREFLFFMLRHYRFLSTFFYVLSSSRNSYIDPQPPSSTLFPTLLHVVPETSDPSLLYCWSSVLFLMSIYLVTHSFTYLLGCILGYLYVYFTYLFTYSPVYLLTSTTYHPTLILRLSGFTVHYSDLSRFFRLTLSVKNLKTSRVRRVDIRVWIDFRYSQVPFKN